MAWSRTAGAQGRAALEIEGDAEGGGHLAGQRFEVVRWTACPIGCAQTCALGRRLSPLRDRALSAGLVTNALVSTVMMATLVVGPFYLARALGLGPALVGLAMSVGPVVAALAGVPAGRIADRMGTRRTTRVGLTAMAVGTSLLASLPRTFDIPGYVGPIAVVTLGYALFQTANNATIMTGAWLNGADAPPVASGHGVILVTPREANALQ